MIRQPALANTLRTIAAKGPEAFYSGAIAEDIVEILQSAGGLHTLDDFQNCRTEVTARHQYTIQRARNLSMPAEWSWCHNVDDA